MCRHVVAGAQAPGPETGKNLLARRRPVRGARRRPPQPVLDCRIPGPTTSQGDAPQRPSQKRPCGPAGLLYTGACPNKTAAIAAP